MYFIFPGKTCCTDSSDMNANLSGANAVSIAKNFCLLKTLHNTGHLDKKKKVSLPDAVAGPTALNLHSSLIACLGSSFATFNAFLENSKTAFDSFSFIIADKDGRNLPF